MIPLFISPELQERFEKDGFVELPLLEGFQVEQLLKSYESFSEPHESISIPYVTTSHSNNKKLITSVDEVLQSVIGPAIGKHLINHSLLFGNFLLKKPVEASETDPHQDITFVDEERYASVNVWVALQDTSIDNGCMYFLPGSHKFMPTIRPTHSYPWAYERVKQDILEHVVAFPCKAGTAFIFHHGIIHGSFANKSSTNRLAAVMAAYHSAAPLVHYYLPQGVHDRLQKYGMTKDAFLSFVKNNPPAEGVFLEEKSYTFRQVDKSEFKKMIDAKKDRSFFRSLVNLFK